MTKAARPGPFARRRLKRVLSLSDFEAEARRRLPRPLFGYIAGGAERNEALLDNAAAFRELKFIPRTMIDVRPRSLATDLFGVAYAAPFGIAPMGLAALMAYRGDIVLARAARTAGIPFAMSATSLIRLEDVAPHNPGAWFQAYIPGDDDEIARQVERVGAAGFKALVVTADVPVLASRENNIRNGFSTPLKPGLRLALDGVTHPGWLLDTAFRTLLRHGMPHFENSFAGRGAPILARSVERSFAGRDGFDWGHLALMRKLWPGPLIIKGILSAEDARLAREHGVDGLIVSNHGGRQLDGAASAVRVLPQIVAAAPGLAVMMDGGIRRGTDVLKALALGACFVFVGRPFLYAAVSAGEAGVLHAATLLKAEIERDMALIGVTSPSQMSPSHLLRTG